MFDLPLLAPILASMLMSLASSLMGTVIVFRKKALVAEVISHATYPGIALALCLGAFLSWQNFNFFILIAAFGSGALALLAIRFLETKARVKEDSAFTFILSSFFGVGVLLTSFLQAKYPLYGKKMRSFLYGQLMTIDEGAVVYYAVFAALVIAIFLCFYKQLKSLLVDREFALVSAAAHPLAEILFMLLIPISVVMAIKSVGVVLLTSMLIAPTIFARSFSDRFSHVLILAAAVSLFSSGCGVVAASFFSIHLHRSIPNGPSIIFVVSLFALIGLFFSPKRGLFVRVWRILNFRFQRVREHLLKILWKKEGTWLEIKGQLGIPSPFLMLALWNLKQRGAVIWDGEQKKYALTSFGKKWGAKIVRLHRLWEVYLFDHLGFGIEEVHKSAEEIEHILSGSLEVELEHLLKNPNKDPHDQPIPTPAET